MDRTKPAKTPRLPALKSLAGEIKQWRDTMPGREAASRLQGQVIVLLDCSASMRDGGKMAQAKAGLQSFASDAIGKGYEVGLIAFASTAGIRCSPTATEALIFQHLSELTPSGSTNIASAIDLAVQFLGIKPHCRVITLITDGEADDVDAAIAAAQASHKRGIDIIAIGTEDADISFLKRIASRADLSMKVNANQLGVACAKASLLLPAPKP